ncbi:hypothetical protein [Roseisolibacter agri]|uniref:Uncharacterized protein n=1 Tax=Roseisolibacter agri TaxID=2014610 RepID=A0AA37QGC4_9BACT|nr:hypothetical protein [Roseisolibacter agri]GLC25283.1 hypothetical protein rosag_17960 [Roseisolibacter agri]
MPTKRQNTKPARARGPGGPGGPGGPAAPTVVSEATARRAVAAIRDLLRELQGSEEPITHTLLQTLLKKQDIPASPRTYYAYVTDGSAIALEIGRAQARQRELSQGTPLARAREEAKELRAYIAELEEANRLLLAQQAAMVAYLTDDANGPGLDVTVVHRAQRASLGEVVRGKPFARRPLSPFAQPPRGPGGGRG